MQTKYSKKILYVALIILTGCATNDKGSDDRAQLNHYSTINQELRVNESDGENYRVPVEGQNFYPLSSPDGEWLAVEVQLMSNLRTLKIFQKTANGYIETDFHAATYLWQRVSHSNGVDIDNVVNSGIEVLKWLDKDRLEIALSGRESNGESFRLTFQFDIAELQE